LIQDLLINRRQLTKIHFKLLFDISVMGVIGTDFH